MLASNECLRRKLTEIEKLLVNSGSVTPCPLPVPAPRARFLVTSLRSVPDHGRYPKKTSPIIEILPYGYTLYKTSQRSFCNFFFRGHAAPPSAVMLR